MKKIKIIVFLFMVSTMFIACGGSDDTPNDPIINPTSDKVIGNWKLLGYENASGVFTAVPACVLVFTKFSANGNFELNVDQCGQNLGVQTGNWIKTANPNEYTTTWDDPENGDPETEVLTFFENNTKYSIIDPNGGVVIYQK